MTTTIRPLRDQVLVRQDPPKDRLSSGLFVPQCSERVLQDDYGTVVATGPGKTGPGGQRIPLDVQVGDRILFKRAPGTALVPDPREGDPDGLKDLLMLRESDIVGVIED